MRVFLIILSFLLLIPFQGKSQVQEKDLVGTWMPVTDQFINNDTTSEYGPYSDVLKMDLCTFIDHKSGFIESAGVNITKTTFTYHIQLDSIFFTIQGNQLINKTKKKYSAKLLRTETNKLSLSFDSFRIINYVRLPEYDTGLSVQELKTNLFSKVWEFRIILEHREALYNILFEFKVPTDSSFIKPTFYNTLHSLNIATESFQNTATDKSFWSIGVHGGTLLLRTENVWSDFLSYTFLVKTVSKNSMLLETYIDGKVHQVLALAKKTPRLKHMRQAFKRLTSVKWRYSYQQDHVLVDSSDYVNLGTLSDYFPEVGVPSYKQDTTAIISQTDLDQKLVILEFNKDYSYSIYRENRLLDSGHWEGSFHNQYIHLKSSRKPSTGDGIYGGAIIINKLLKNRLDITRSLIQQVDSFTPHEHTAHEIYKPIKKRN